jgi:hypothetical protein
MLADRLTPLLTTRTRRLLLRSRRGPARVLGLSALQLVLGLQLSACGEDNAEGASTSSGPPDTSAPATTATPSTTESGGAGAPNAPVAPSGAELGHFDLTFHDTATSFTGIVYGTPQNQIVSHEVIAAAGDCEVRKPKVFACTPACAGGEDCTIASECVAQPEPVTVGALTVSGVKKRDASASFVLEPLSPTNLKYNVAGLAVPPFTPGDAISVSAAGGDLQPFTLHARGFAAVAFENADPVTFEAGKPTELTWIAGDPELARIELIVDVGHHGGSTAEIVCDVEDTGSYTIPGELTTALSEQGVAGFPQANIERHVTTYANLSSGYVELNITSRATVYLNIPGLVSCTEDDECPAGQVCKMPDLQCVAE